HTARAGDFKVPRPMPLQSDVSHDLPGAAMLVENLGMAVGGQRSHLSGIYAIVDSPGLELESEINRLLFQFADFKFHSLSLRRGVRPVNVSHDANRNLLILLDLVHEF